MMLIKHVNVLQWLCSPARTVTCWAATQYMRNVRDMPLHVTHMNGLLSGFLLRMIDKWSTLAITIITHILDPNDSFAQIPVFETLRMMRSIHEVWPSLAIGKWAMQCGLTLIFLVIDVLEAVKASLHRSASIAQRLVRQSESSSIGPFIILQRMLPLKERETTTVS